MHTIRKKLSACLAVCLFLSLILFSGCSHIPSGNADKKFESYTNALFCQEVSANSISLHYTLKDPESFGITNAPVTFGSITTDSAAVCASAENALAVLKSCSRDQLSEKNKLTYDVLEDYLSSALESAKYTLYEEPLAPLTGTQAQLPVLLSEYQFYDTADIDTYLKLLTKVPEYFQSLITFEQAKSDAGLFMSSHNADALIDECTAFIGMGEDCYLYSSFEERLNNMDLPENDLNSYIEENKNCIDTYIFPAYQSLADALVNLRDTSKNENGLCYLPDGRNYYEKCVARETGSSRSIEDLKKLTLAQIQVDLNAMQQILASESDGVKTSAGISLNTPDPSAIIDDLKSKLNPAFPQPPEVNTQIKYVQKSMEEYLSPAFYMVPAIDSTKDNTIYINQGHLPNDISLYTTLAHEGYPGHLYQTVYYASLNPDPIRNLLNFSGYTEGWATYSEMISYYYAPIPKAQATLLQHNTSVILGLYALADMGIHYDGWTLAEAGTFFHNYGITSDQTIEDIYNLIIADPANYLKYYIGYVEFMELKKEAMEQWGSGFTQERFHRAVLETGPASFDIIRKNILK